MKSSLKLSPEQGARLTALAAGPGKRDGVVLFKATRGNAVITPEQVLQVRRCRSARMNYPEMIRKTGLSEWIIRGVLLHGRYDYLMDGTVTKKSLSKYEETIRQYHEDLQKIPDYHPDFEKKQEQLSRQLTAWAAKLDINIRVASNEQLPWTDKELGMITIPMEKKAASGYNQTGDYQFEILRDIQDIFPGGLLVERKTLEDIYGSLMSRDSRNRLYREITRYEGDPRFNRMILIAECTYEEFLNYVPEIFVFTQDSVPETLKKNIKQYLQRFYKIKVSTEQISPDCGGLEIFVKGDKKVIYITGVPDGAEVFIDGVLRETLTKRKTSYGKTQYFVRRGASEASKIETINSLENRIQVSFAGSRARAVEKYPGLIRQWCRLNYATILQIDG